MNAGVSEANTYDVVIVGSGAAAVPAALLAKDHGASAVIIEKTDKIGGSTAMSGGVLWVPNNPVMKRMGRPDSHEAAKRYLDACAGPYQPGSTPERRHAFLSDGPPLISYLEGKGMKFMMCYGWPDYHEGEYPGGVPEGRALCSPPLDLNALGPWLSKFRTVDRPPAHSHEGSLIFLYGKTWKSKLKLLEVGSRMALNKIGMRLSATGQSLQGRLLQIAVRNDLEFWIESPMVELVQDATGRVTGVVVEREGRRIVIGARRGVLINCGGFARNQAMRDKWNNKPSPAEFSLANPGDTGEALEMLMALGAPVHNMDLCWWNPHTRAPSGAMAYILREGGFPHCIYVDSNGERFTNEATSYVQMGLNAYARQKTAEAQPCWAVFDTQHRRSYMWARHKPGYTPQSWIDAGYFLVANSVDELARKIGVPADKLKLTIERFNGFARTGVDEDYHRNGRAGMGKHLSDPSHGPDGSLGTIEVAPFYAVKCYQGDVGTAGGVVCDEHARVLRKDGSVILGLYATGNTTAPVVGRSYPGAGASIASSAIFGWRAVKHALGINADASAPSSAAAPRGDRAAASA